MFDDAADVKGGADEQTEWTKEARERLDNIEEKIKGLHNRLAVAVINVTDQQI